MTTYHIVELAPDAMGGFCPRGGALQLWRCKAPEAMLSGPAETGKTYGSLKKLDALMWKYAGAQGAIIRKAYSTMPGSVLQTFEKKVLGAATPVVPFGGEKAQWYDYPNGSRVWVGGLDNPDKVLSSERDVIYVNQAEELELVDWETLTTRATGRAGNMPYGQVFGDCNPGPPMHWILQRGSLKLFESRHEDNPVLFDDQGVITEQGRRSLAVLDELTGVRKQRLRYGRWVGTEGQVYEFDKRVHLLDRLPAGWERWRKIRAIDFGFSNPFCCQWWAIDGDGRMYLYREIYMSQRTVKVHVVGEKGTRSDPKPRSIAASSRGEQYEVTVADHDEEDRATLLENGISTKAAYKAVSRGIQATQDRLKVAGDGRPRLFVLRDALVEVDATLAGQHHPVNTEQEFDAYIWATAPNGKPNKEEPLDVFNHGMDAMRYAVAYVDNLGSGRPMSAAAGGKRVQIGAR